MKTSIGIALFAAMAAMTACDKKDEGGDKGGADGTTGIEECDAFFAVLEKCMGNASKEAQDDYKARMDQFRSQAKNATDDAQKTAVGVGCKTSAEALKMDPNCK
jgi:hypothetical protein